MMDGRSTRILCDDLTERYGDDRLYNRSWSIDSWRRSDRSVRSDSQGFDIDDCKHLKGLSESSARTTLTTCTSSSSPVASDSPVVSDAQSIISVDCTSSSVSSSSPQDRYGQAGCNASRLQCMPAGGRTPASKVPREVQFFVMDEDQIVNEEERSGRKEAALNIKLERSPVSEKPRPKRRSLSKAQAPPASAQDIMATQCYSESPLKPAARPVASPLRGREPQGVSEEIIRYLPKNLNGKPVLIHEGGTSYRADNAQLQATTPGLAFRFSKDLAEKDRAHTARWESSVEGTDEGDGWVKVNLARQERKVQLPISGRFGMLDVAENRCDDEGDDDSPTIVPLLPLTPNLSGLLHPKSHLGSLKTIEDPQDRWWYD